MAAQPSDETPLAGDTVVPVLPDAAKAIPGLLQDVTNDKAAVVSAAEAMANASKVSIANAYGDVADAATSDVQSVKDSLTPAYQSVIKQVKAVASNVKSTVQDGETALWQAGVKTPLSMTDRTTDLQDETGAAFDARIAPALAPAVTDDVQLKIPTLPPGCTEADTPIRNPDGTYTCAPGQVLYVYTAPDGSTQYACYIPEQCKSPPPPLTPPVVGLPPSPPFQPPPPAPPVVLPPPTVPPPPPPSGSCSDPTEATLLQCLSVPIPPLPVQYWVTVDCTDQCSPTACIYSGQLPPTKYTGVIVIGPVSDMPTLDSINAALAGHCPTATPIPPPVPPSPPASPPPPPPCTTDDAPGQLEAFIGGDFDCTVPPPAAPPPPPPTHVQRPPATWGWGSFSSCATVHSTLVSIINQPKDSAKVAQQAKGFAERTGSIAYLIPGISDAIRDEYTELHDNDPNAVLPAPQDRAGEIYSGLTAIAAKMLKGVSNGTLPNPVAATKLGTKLAVADRVQLASGFPLDYIMQGDRYLFQYANPQFIPNQGEIDALYNTGRIDSASWQCYTQANGNIPTLFEHVRDAKSAYPSTREVIELSLRGYYKNDADYKHALKRSGITSADALAEYGELAHQLPQSSDIIRFMVRDVYDPLVVAEYNLDEDFDKKFPGDAQKAATAIGVDTDTMLHQWRAHWQISSNTAMFEMVHRLRPDRKEVQDWINSPIVPDLKGIKAGLGPKPPVFTPTDLERALKINDLAPFFVPATVAIQYRPITNTDAIRMYDVGYIDDSQLIERIRDNGYNLADATTITSFHASERRKLIANRSGVWTVRKIVAAVKAGTITKQQFNVLALPQLVDQNLVDQLWNQIQTEIASDSKNLCAKALKKRYLYGEFTDDVLAAKLLAIGIDLLRVQTYVQNWSCEKASHVKEPRIAMVIQWFQAGALTLDQFTLRLQNLGYIDADIATIINTLNLTAQAKNIAAQARAAAAAARAAQTQLKRNLDMKVKLETEAYNAIHRPQIVQETELQIQHLEKIDHQPIT
jgi:hypothetical protein